MKLTEFLKSRQNGLSKNVEIAGKDVLLHDAKKRMTVHGWETHPPEVFRDFMTEYVIPENEAFTPKDRIGLKTNIPHPQVILSKEDGNLMLNMPFVALFLYTRAPLTGNAELNIRSINKFEQMWIPYFIQTSENFKNNPKIIPKDGFSYCHSNDIRFSYSIRGIEQKLHASLKIFAFDFNDHVMLAYMLNTVDKPLTEEEITNFVGSIRHLE